MIKNNTVSFCVPITATDKNELKAALDKAIRSGVDLIEYRRDYLQNDKQENTIYKLLHDNINKVEIIFTFRDFKEGGQTEIDDEDRFISIIKALDANCFNYLDIEEAVTEKFLKTVGSERLKGIKLIVSAHNFKETPDGDAILNQLLRSNEVADIVKAAYTVNSQNDLNNLIWASQKFREESDKPLILIGMGERGQQTRIFPEILGSNLTFTPLDVEAGSAPGQLDFKTIKNLRESFDEKKKTCLLDRTDGFWKDDNR